MTIDLNCDMGEGLPNDAALMPFISSANIACGFHAGDETSMKHTTALALEYGVAIGAHPGFADKTNFGRREMLLSPEAVYDLVSEQIAVLQQVAFSFQTALHHVKPHGALYNMAARDPVLSAAIARAVKAADPTLVLFGLSGSHLIGVPQSMGLRTASEVFADRTYQNDGSLTPRSDPHALIEDTAQALQQVVQMIQTQTVTSVHQQTIPIRAETLCIHGDGVHAVSFAQQIYQTLQHHQIGIQKI